MVEGFNWRREQNWRDLRWLAFHSAILTRVEKFPKYDEFMGIEAKAEQIQRVPWQELQARIRGSLPQ